MSDKVQLDDITRISSQVVRVLGQNPGKFTLQGTNTYIIGKQNPYVLVDTAEGLPSYIPILSSALNTVARPSDPTQPDVSDIIISHWHHDHIGGITHVLDLLKALWEARNPGLPYSPPRLHKHPIPEGMNDAHESTKSTRSNEPSGLSTNLYTPAPNGKTFHDLHEGQVFRNSDGDVLFRVLHTPGHTADSIALYLPADKALYTADTVLGYGTTVFEDLSAYLDSLQRLLELGSTDSDSNTEFGSYHILYPGHGPVVANGQEIISTYIRHRLDREKEILKVLHSPIPREWLQTSDDASVPDEAHYWTTWNIVRVIYKNYPESLWLPACQSIELHLLKLQRDGIAQHTTGEGPGKTWRLLGCS